MIKNKKQSLIVISVFTLVMLLGTVTYAFFNYTRTGSPNNFSVGRIFFKSDNEETITLSNLFPIDPSNSTDMADPTKVGTYSIDITGDTDYVDGLEYLVSIVDSNISNLPISIDVSVSSGLGTSNANYFTARESKNASIYKRLMGNTITGDGMLLVGYVKPNTTSGVIEGVDGTITITAYLDKNKILISDTYDGTESDNMGTTNAQAEGKTVLTTTEWNALSTNGLSFKIKVEANEGIWVNESLEEIMKTRSVIDNTSSTFVSASTGINFTQKSSNTNGKGIYMRAGTENDEYPIAYYRGAVTDNNVLFADKCWKAIRTTDTGGVKMIYNGEKAGTRVLLQESEYGTLLTNVGNFTYQSNTNNWSSVISANVTYPNQNEMSFHLPVGTGYLIDIAGNSGTGASLQIYASKHTESNEVTNLGSLYVSSNNYDSKQIIVSINSDTDIIKIQYNGNATTSNRATVYVKVYKNDYSQGVSCNNTQVSTRIEMNGSNNIRFSTQSGDYNSPAYVGYMYGNIYTYNTGNVNGAYYDSSYTWDGTNYHLSDSATTTISNNAHYSCGIANEKTCTTIRYYYTNYYYINLNNGDGVEEALRKMKTNTTNSYAKTSIDSWYSSNLLSYTNIIEDTTYCNDRSMKTNTNGWIANGGNLSENLYFGSSARQSSGIPSMTCPDKNDAFTVALGRGNGALTYPIGMITFDEFMLAGDVDMGSSSGSYLGSSTRYWSMSPYYFLESLADEYVLSDSNVLYRESVDYSSVGIRPVISIKPCQMIKGGTGTATDPYVIE